MKTAVVSYLESVKWLEEPEKERALKVVELCQKYCPEEIDEIYISEFIGPDKVMQIEGLWCFSKSFLMEAKSFRSKLKIDLVRYFENVTYYEINFEDFEPTAMSAAISISDHYSAILKASGDNCKLLEKILLERIKPSITNMTIVH